MKEETGFYKLTLQHISEMCLDQERLEEGTPRYQKKVTCSIEKLDRERFMGEKPLYLDLEKFSLR